MEVFSDAVANVMGDGLVTPITKEVFDKIADKAFKMVRTVH